MNNRLLDSDGLSNSNNDDNNNNNNNNGFIFGVIEGFYGKPWSFEQRKDLFKRLKDLKLNSFLYAPKDDSKHRAKWRQPYSEFEANELRILIEEAKANGIDFYYSLAPGLDMTYSDQEDLNTLVRKYDQIVSLGCESFAILFDDIEPTLNDKDKELFKDNYASAQVSVANTIYEHLKQPKFLFCPTEYCESRSMPTVTESIYLNTIGHELNTSIDFLWSGSRVISRLITEDSIETLTRVIKRPPLIWENLHANDYDKKRVFLGPYSGRSTKIIPKIRGVLTNPNCEYEANYIAIHTLAQWSRCTGDINLHNRCNPDKRVPENETISAEHLSNGHLVYNPDAALIRAIRDWLPHLSRIRPLPSGMNLVINNQPRQCSDDSAAAIQLVKDTDQDTQTDYHTDVVEMVPDESQSSRGSASTSNKSEMDTSGSLAPVTVLVDAAVSTSVGANLIDSNSCDSCDMQDVSPTVAAGQEPTSTSVSNPKNSSDLSCIDCVMCSTSADKSASEVTAAAVAENDQASHDIQREQINFDNLSLLVDLFYLPFEHGYHGCALLKDIKWLKDNSDFLNAEDQQVVDNNKDDETRMNDDDNDNDQSRLSSNLMVESWIDRAEKLDNLCTCISRLVNTLIYDCPNQLLIIELYPYLAGMRDVTSMITDYIKFLRYRTSAQDCFYYLNNSKLKESTSSDEQEPWVHRGGLVGDVQRLLS